MRARPTSLLEESRREGARTAAEIQQTDRAPCRHDAREPFRVRPRVVFRFGRMRLEKGLVAGNRPEVFRGMLAHPDLFDFGSRGEVGGKGFPPPE
jgi:hypothetical protein